MILAASVPQYRGSRLNPWIVLKNAGSLIYEVVTMQWEPLFASAERLFTDPALLGTLLAGFAISAAVAYYVRYARSLVFSRLLFRPSFPFRNLPDMILFTVHTPHR